MFSIGDKILYPMHGAAVIEDIEKKDILGEIREYYILRLPYGDLNIMLPVSSCADIGVRGIIESTEIDSVLSVLNEDSTKMSSNWNKRYRENMDKLKTGDIYQVAEVVRNLLRVDRIKKLSTGERKMLVNAKQILESELILSGNLEPEKVDTLIEETV